MHMSTSSFLLHFLIVRPHCHGWMVVRIRNGRPNEHCLIARLDMSAPQKVCEATSRRTKKKKESPTRRPLPLPSPGHWVTLIFDCSCGAFFLWLNEIIYVLRSLPQALGATFIVRRFCLLSSKSSWAVLIPVLCAKKKKSSYQRGTIKNAFTGFKVLSRPPP
ncbi:MAG: hypothetical protein J3Q66DRAFT_135072 [Benniella sp.]|nr:MAG: hypothetical protein J3Q66DRAFT_135072 [Benniella sp.]